jgi:drug/metabolite transporter (DMT)-like permease
LSRLYLFAVLWGSGFLFVKLALRGLSPVQVVLGQLAFGAIVLLLTLAVRRQPLPHASREWAYLAGMAVLATSPRTSCSRGASSGSARALLAC